MVWCCQPSSSTCLGGVVAFHGVSSAIFRVDVRVDLNQQESILA